MSNPDDIDARHARQIRTLRRLAELGLEQASALQERMLRAKPSEVAALAAEFERVAGEVREAISAEAELERRRRRARLLAQERVRPPRKLIPDPENRTVH
jgi:hypothetical protein